MNTTDLNSLKQELTSWETKNQPGTVQGVFTLLLFFWGYIQSDPFSIEIPMVRNIVVVVFIIACITIPYFLIKAMLPARIKKLRKDIAHLEYIELVKNYE